MAKTSRAGSVHAIFGIDSISSVIAEAVGGSAPDYDLPILEEKYRAQLEGLLPYGWTIRGDDVYRSDEADDIADLGDLRAQAAKVDTDYSKNEMVGWLEQAQRELTEAERRTKELRARRDQVVRIALEAGLSGYRVAQVLGISETAVGKIRRAVLDAAERLGRAVEEGTMPLPDAIAEIVNLGAGVLDEPVAVRMLEEWRTVRAQYDRFAHGTRPGPSAVLSSLFGR